MQRTERGWHVKIAVGSLGLSLDAWVGGRFGYCPQFVVVDTDTMEFVVVPMPHAMSEQEASLQAIRTVVRSGAEVLLVAQAKPKCREIMNQLGVEVIEGVEGLTVRQAVERYLRGAMAQPAGRKGEPPKVAVAATAASLDAPVGARFGEACYFLVVDLQTMAYQPITVSPVEAGKHIRPQTVRALVEAGANVVITPAITPLCCQALQALAVEVIIAGEGRTVREVVEQYRRGELAASRRGITGEEEA